MYVFRRLKRNRPVEQMTQAEIQQSYWQSQVERQRQAAETEAGLARARAEYEAGVPQGNESTVPWQRDRQNGGGWLDRRF